MHEAELSCSTLDLLDTSRLTLKEPHPVWVAAGRDAVDTSRAVYQMWLLLGVYNTQERLHKMSKVKTAICQLCREPDQIEDRVHFLLSCSKLADIRDNFLCQLEKISGLVKEYMEVSPKFLVCLLDPFSPKVPEDLRNSWETAEDIYKWARNFCYAMHNKRTKILAAITGNN